MYITELKKLIEPLICMENNELYYEIRELSKTSNGEINLLVMCSEEIFGYVVGKAGVVANSLRSLLNIRAKFDNNKINLKFEVL